MVLKPSQGREPRRRRHVGLSRDARLRRRRTSRRGQYFEFRARGRGVGVDGGVGGNVSIDRAIREVTSTPSTRPQFSLSLSLSLSEHLTFVKEGTAAPRRRSARGRGGRRRHRRALATVPNYTSPLSSHPPQPPHRLRSEARHLNEQNGAF